MRIHPKLAWIILTVSGNIITMNKADLIRKIAVGADISIAEATRALHSFESAITPKKKRTFEAETALDNSHAWRSGNKKKGNKFKYTRK